jgi:hypothetical protein
MGPERWPKSPVESRRPAAGPAYQRVDHMRAQAPHLPRAFPPVGGGHLPRGRHCRTAAAAARWPCGRRFRATNHCEQRSHVPRSNGRRAASKANPGHASRCSEDPRAEDNENPQFSWAWLSQFVGSENICILKRLQVLRARGGRVINLAEDSCLGEDGAETHLSRLNDRVHAQSWFMEENGWRAVLPHAKRFGANAI